MQNAHTGSRPRKLTASELADLAIATATPITVLASRSARAQVPSSVDPMPAVEDVDPLVLTEALALLDARLDVGARLAARDLRARYASLLAREVP